jgi:hypothetical protein
VNESNKFNCDYLIPTFKASKKAGALEMSGKYYQENAERVNMFIARAAVRGAKYLDTVLASCDVVTTTYYSQLIKLIASPITYFSLVFAAKAA